MQNEFSRFIFSTLQHSIDSICDSSAALYVFVFEYWSDLLSIKLNIRQNTVKFDGFNWSILLLTIDHCFWPAMYRFWQNVLKTVQKMPVFSNLPFSKLRHSQKLWLGALDSWEDALEVYKKSGRKIFFHHGEIWFWKFENFENSKKNQQKKLKNIKFFNTIKYFFYTFFSKKLFFKYFRKYFQKLQKIFFQNQNSPWWKNIFRLDFF